MEKKGRGWRRSEREEERGREKKRGRERENERTNTCPCHRRLSWLDPGIYAGQ